MFLKSKSWSTASLYAPDRSTRISFKTRNISTGRLAIRILPFARRRFATSSNASLSRMPWVHGTSHRGSRTVPTIPARKTFASGSAILKKASEEIHAALKPGQRLLLEYKPFEPAFYHTDIADWGMAFLLAKQAGPQAFVLVDTGHHYQAQNIEQIVAWLLHHKMIGGFHFNDRRYADDDLTLGSIDPYQIFRIFHEIRMFEWESQTTADIAYMVDQSHNLKGKIEAMIQTVCTAQELYARAVLVDHGRLAKLQQDCSLIDAEETLRGAFWSDVRPAVREWRKSRGLPEDPLLAFRSSGYLERVTRERSERNRGTSATYA